MPYITASIILQLLVVVSPALEKLQKEGEVGQARITQYTRYLTVGLAGRAGRRLHVPVPLAGLRRRHAGVRELQRRHGHPRRALPDGRLDPRHVDGRADHPARHRQRHLADDLRLDRRRPAAAASRSGGPTRTRSSRSSCRSSRIGVVAAVVFIQEGQRRIPIQYAKRVIGRRMSSRRADLPAAAREHGGRDPGHLRRVDHGLPAHDRPARPGPGGSRDLLQPRRLGLRARRDADDHRLHVLLHRGHVQPGRPGGQPEEVRRVHPRRAAGPARRRSSWTASSPA